MELHEAASIVPIFFITTMTVFQFITRPRLNHYMDTSRLRTRADRLITLNIAVLTFLAAVQTTWVGFVLPLHVFSGYTAGMMFQEVAQGMRNYKSNTNGINQDKNQNR